MARRRQKSVNDIANQENRITRALGGFDARNTPRYRRVQGIADRYYANIQNTPTWRNAFNTARENALAGTPAALRSGGRLAEANTIGYGAADNIRFPQSVYMGLNNG